MSSCSFQSALDEQGNVTIRSQGKVMLAHGERTFEKLKQERTVSKDPRYTAPVDRVAKRLKEAIQLPDTHWEFVVFKDASPNAFALPGGKVGINTGLFPLADSDELLAAVIGHEIAHATAAHARQRMIHAIGIILSGALVYHVLEKNDFDHPEQAIAAYGLGAYLFGSLPLSRKQEYESDRIGAIYMAKAGYDPRQSIELWKKLARYHIGHSHGKPQFMRTHPNEEKRIRALHSFMPTAMRHYHQSRFKE